MGLFPTLIATLFIVICILLIVVVLLQKGRGGGLGAAFGGAGGGAFGTRTGDVFTWVTIGLTAAFLLMAITTTLVFQQKGTVTPVVFDPPSQVGESPTYVSISTVTPGADIYYTIDGSEPTEDSTKYDEKEPVTVEAGQTLRARAYRARWVPSAVASRLYDSPANLELETTTTPAAMPAEQD